MMIKNFLNIPVFNALGNHESFPVNQYEGPGADNWLYSVVSADWSHWLPVDAERTLAYGGYYTARVRPGLRVVALHTTVFSSDDFWLVKNNTDFSSQLPWLKDVLKQSRALGERVIIIGHHPTQSLEQEWAEPLTSLYGDFQAVIVGLFGGHWHTSGIQVMYPNVNVTEPFTTAFLAGSVTPGGELNPGFRLYTYDRSLKFAAKGGQLVKDFTENWVDVEEANTHPESEPDWAHSERFSARRLWNFTTDPIAPQEWVELAKRMVKDESLATMWQWTYYRGVEQTTPETAEELSCEMRSMTNEQYSTCLSAIAVPGRIYTGRDHKSEMC